MGDDVDALPAFKAARIDAVIRIGLDVGGIAFIDPPHEARTRERAPAPHPAVFRRAVRLLSAWRWSKRSLPSPSSPVRPPAASRRWRWRSPSGPAAQSSMPTAPKSIAICRSSPPRPLRRSGSRGASALRHPRWSRTLLCRRLGGLGQGGNRADCMTKADCRSWSAEPGFISARCSTASLRSRRSTPRFAPVCAQPSVAENLAALAAARSGCGGHAQPRRHDPNRARARGCQIDGPDTRPLAGAARGRDRRARSS